MKIEGIVFISAKLGMRHCVESVLLQLTLALPYGVLPCMFC